MFRNKIIMSVLFLGLIGGVLIGTLLYHLEDGFDLNWYIASLFFFLILEVFIVACVESKSHKVEQKKLVNIYMLTKVVKILLTLVFATIYALAVKENIKTFILNFSSLYVFFLIIESSTFVKIEKHLKEKNKEE